MTASRFFTHPLGIFAASVGATLLWGSSYPFIKLSYAALGIGASDTYKQLLFAGYRFTCAGLLILLFMLVRGESLRFRRVSAPFVGSLALVQTVLQYICFYTGMSMSAGVVGSVIAGTISFFQIVLAHFLYRDDRLNAAKTTGLTIGFCGLLVLAFDNPGGASAAVFSPGELLLIGSAFFSACGNLLSRRGAASYSVSYLNGYQMALGGLVLCALAVWQTGLFPFVFDWRSSLMLLHLSFVSAAGFMLWNNVMKYNRVGSVSMYLFLIPVFGVIQSAVFLSEPIRAAVLIALVLVSIGIIVVNRRKSPAPEGTAARAAT